jgi:hypothetical protein
MPSAGDHHRRDQQGGKDEEDREELSADNIVPKQIQVGSTVLARLHDGREVIAKITALVDSVVGRKVRIAFGAFALIVDEAQIVRATL